MIGLLCQSGMRPCLHWTDEFHNAAQPLHILVLIATSSSRRHRSLTDEVKKINLSKHSTTKQVSGQALTKITHVQNQKKPQTSVV